MTKRSDVTAPDRRENPAWYGAVMGTGALSMIAAAQLSLWGWTWLSPVAIALLLLASLLAVVLLPRYLRRARRGRLRSELAGPSGPMLATFPAGLLILSAAWSRSGSLLVSGSAAVAVAAALLVVGTVVALFMGLLWLDSVIESTPKLDDINGSWLIPAVMHLLVPIALAPVIASTRDWAAVLEVVGFGFFGLGLLLFLFVQALIVARLILRPPLPPAVVAATWIPLAPGALLGVALLSLLTSGAAAGLSGFSGSSVAGVAVAAMGLGFSLWWTVSATLQTRSARKVGPLVPTAGWWAFVFPTATVALSLAAVASVLRSELIRGFSLVAAVAVAVLWIVVAIRTVRR